LIVVFGLAALLCFGFSVKAKKQSRYAAGLGFAVLELLSTIVCTWSWAHALKISGKIDWFVFGLWGYPLLGLICYAMYAAGVWCIVVNVRGAIRQKKLTAPL